MRRFQLSLAVVLAASVVAGAYAQSQADKTGTGGTAVAGQETGGSFLTHPITLGVVVAGAIGVAVATASDDSSPLMTTTTVTSTTTTTTR